VTIDSFAIEKKVRALINRYLKKRKLAVTITSDDSLINRGIIDSLGALEIVHELEIAFRITISPDEMTESNFDSVKKMVSFIKEKLNK